MIGKKKSMTKNENKKPELLIVPTQKWKISGQINLRASIKVYTWLAVLCSRLFKIMYQVKNS